MAAAGPAPARDGQRAGVPRAARRRGRTGQGRHQVWPALAAVGVLMLTQPWSGTRRPRGRGLRAGRGRVLGGVHPADPARRRRRRGHQGAGRDDARRRPGRDGRRRPEHLRPADPRAAARRASASLCCCRSSPSPSSCWRCAGSPTTAFGTLMSLEPAFAVLVGLVVLHQVPNAVAVVGIGFVVAAGIGAARSGPAPRSSGTRARHRGVVQSDSVVPGRKRRRNRLDYRDARAWRYRCSGMLVASRAASAYAARASSGRPATLEQVRVHGVQPVGAAQGRARRTAASSMASAGLRPVRLADGDGVVERDDRAGRRGRRASRRAPRSAPSRCPPPCRPRRARRRSPPAAGTGRPARAAAPSSTSATPSSIEVAVPE